MKGSLWKCSHLQCKHATSEENRGLEIQNALLSDMRQELLQPNLRRNYVDVEREGNPSIADTNAEEIRITPTPYDVIEERAPPQPAEPPPVGAPQQESRETTQPESEAAGVTPNSISRAPSTIAEPDAEMSRQVSNVTMRPRELTNSDELPPATRPRLSESAESGLRWQARSPGRWEPVHEENADTTRPYFPIFFRRRQSFRRHTS